MRRGLISVIMPVYNVEHYISDAIESVISQTYGDWELLVINDGATDLSRVIASEYAGKDCRIKIIDKENGGLSDARNTGLKFAQGEFVHFFDSDDRIVPDYYSVMVNAIVSTNADIVISGFINESIDSNGEVSQDAVSVSRNAIPHNIEDCTRMMGVINYAWNKLFRSDFLKSHELYYRKGLSYIEDVEFMSRVLPYHPRIVFHDFNGYVYMHRPRITLSSEFSVTKIELELDRIVYTRGILADLGVSEPLRECFIKRRLFNSLKWILTTLFEYDASMTGSGYIPLLKRLRDTAFADEVIKQGFAKSLTDKMLKAVFTHRLYRCIIWWYSTKKLARKVLSR